MLVIPLAKSHTRLVDVVQVTGGCRCAFVDIAQQWQMSPPRTKTRLNAREGENTASLLTTSCPTYVFQVTVVVAIHQPRPEIWQLFSHTVLLKSGRVVFCGPVVDALDEISRCGYWRHRNLSGMILSDQCRGSCRTLPGGTHKNSMDSGYF